MLPPCRLLRFHDRLPRHLTRLSLARRLSSVSAFVVERCVETQPQMPHATDRPESGARACHRSIPLADQSRVYHARDAGRVAGLLVHDRLQSPAYALLSLALVQTAFVDPVEIFHERILLADEPAADRDGDLTVRLYRQRLAQMLPAVSFHRFSHPCAGRLASLVINRPQMCRH